MCLFDTSPQNTRDSGERAVGAAVVAVAVAWSRCGRRRDGSWLGRLSGQLTPSPREQLDSGAGREKPLELAVVQEHECVSVDLLGHEHVHPLERDLGFAQVRGDLDAHRRGGRRLLRHHQVGPLAARVALGEVRRHLCAQLTSVVVGGRRRRRRPGRGRRGGGRGALRRRRATRGGARRRRRRRKSGGGLFDGRTGGHGGRSAVRRRVSLLFRVGVRLLAGSMEATAHGFAGGTRRRVPRDAQHHRYHAARERRPRKHERRDGKRLAERRRPRVLASSASLRALDAAHVDHFVRTPLDRRLIVFEPADRPDRRPGLRADAQILRARAILATNKNPPPGRATRRNP